MDDTKTVIIDILDIHIKHYKLPLGRVILAPLIMACARAWSLFSIAWTAALNASQISLRPEWIFNYYVSCKIAILNANKQ